VNVIIDLYRNADAVALADAKATGKYNLILDVIFFNRAFKQFYNLRGALQVTGGSHTNLNEQHNLHLCQNLVCEELANGFGSYRMEGVVNGYANAHLAFTHAKGTAKLYFIGKIVFGNQILQLLYYLARALDVAGATDANCNFKHFILPHNISIN
jgi:hypothetical protein